MEAIKTWSFYKITNPIGEFYVGRTSNMATRLSAYRCCDNRMKGQRLIYESLIKYGFDRHEIIIIDTIIGIKKQADEKEAFWIAAFMSNKNKYPNWKGLNLTDGGSGCKGFIQQESVKTFLSNISKGKKKSRDTIKKMTDFQIKTNGKVVSQYDKAGNFIMDHLSIGSAAKHINYSQANITACLKGRQNTAKGFIFKYKQND